MSIRKRSQPASPVNVSVRRVGPLTPRTDFIRTGATPVWMERLEARRVMSAATAAIGPAVSVTDPYFTNETFTLIATDPTTSDGSDDTGGDGSDSTDDGSDSSDATPSEPTNVSATGTQYLAVVDENGNVVQAYQFTSTSFGSSDDLELDPVVQIEAADVKDWVPTDLAVGGSTIVSYDPESGDASTAASVPAKALPDAWFDQITRIDTATPAFVAANNDYLATIASGDDGPTDNGDGGDVIDNPDEPSGPTTDVETSTTLCDVVDDAGNVVQSYRLSSKYFGSTGTDPVDYMQISLADLNYTVPATLEVGGSVSYHYSDETGDPVIDASVPTIADVGSWYTTATRIATDDADLLAQRTAFNTAPTRGNPGWSDGWLERGDVGGPLVDHFGGVIETMVGGELGAGAVPEASNTPTDVSITPTPTGGAAGSVPLPALPTVEARTTNDVLTGKKKDDVLDHADASLIALVR